MVTLMVSGMRVSKLSLEVLQHGVVPEGIYPSFASEGSVVAENCKYPDKDIWLKIAGGCTLAV